MPLPYELFVIFAPAIAVLLLTSGARAMARELKLARRLRTDRRERFTETENGS